LDPSSWTQTATRSNRDAAASKSRGKQVNVVICHAAPIVRAGLAALLKTAKDMHVAEANADEARQSCADVIILDYLGALYYLDQYAADCLSGASPRVLIVTQRDREWEVRRAITAGAHGYLLQGAEAEDLLMAVRVVSRHIRYLSAGLSPYVADHMSPADLTGRENDVLQLMAQGYCNKSIARQLGIGVGTVKTHVKALFGKLGATARTHAVALATRRGLVCDGAARQH